MKKILVLLSSYNGGEYIEKQINSILEQEGVEVGLLIRDDGSSHNFLLFLDNLVSSHSNIILLKEKNIGCAESYKRLMLMAFEEIPHYDYFAFADQDDYWMEDKLSTAVDCLSQYKDDQPVMYCSNLMLADKDLRPMGVMRKNEETIPNNKIAGFLYNMATGCTLVMNPTVIKMFHDYQPKNLHLHDSWIYYMCLYFGTVIYDSTPHILYRQHGKNVDGWPKSKWAFFKRKLKRLANENSYHADVMCKEFLSVYSERIPQSEKKALNLMANYRNNLCCKMQLLFLSNKYGIKRETLLKNLILKTRIIINKL